jgi:N-acyl-D-amino-acid deacylase
VTLSCGIAIRGGTVYDGLGGSPVVGDVAIDGDRISAVAPAGGALGDVAIDAQGLAVAPGFINMLSWATEALLADGRSMGDILQGVTLEVFGEGTSMGPLTPAMRAEMIEQQADIKFDIPWTTLGEYLSHLQVRGVSCNVASFVGATTVRIHELGYDDRPPSADELRRMRALVRDAMAEGALGLGTSLLYAPASFASTEELVALYEEAAALGGLYISHIRNESHRVLEAIDELISIADRAGGRGEIYHIKASGAANYQFAGAMIERIERARRAGLQITADMYPYAASSTGLDATMPHWVQEGGLDAWIARLRLPGVRERVAAEMREPRDGWESSLHLAGGPERVLLVGFKDPALKPLTGLTLADVMRKRGTSVEETIIDLVVEDHTRVSCVYFGQSEDVVRTIMAQPWVSFGSDGSSQAPEGVFLHQSTHPRSYGTFARVLGRYVREEQILGLSEAIRRLTSLPADNLRLSDRGRLVEGAFADVVVFDPAAVADHATFDQPQRLASGIEHVLVNGVLTVRNGRHVNAFAGRFLRGPAAPVAA